MLKMKAIPVIINALRALFHDEELQVEGLKMVKTLSMTSEVRRTLPVDTYAPIGNLI